MKIAVLKERRFNETRVAATPDTVKKLAALKHTVAIETGAGATAGIRDEDYIAAGATINSAARTEACGARCGLTPFSQRFDPSVRSPSALEVR